MPSRFFFRVIHTSKKGSSKGVEAPERLVGEPNVLMHRSQSETKMYMHMTHVHVHVPYMWTSQPIIGINIQIHRSHETLRGWSGCHLGCQRLRRSSGILAILASAAAMPESHAAHHLKSSGSKFQSERLVSKSARAAESAQTGAGKPHRCGTATSFCANMSTSSLVNARL
mgnify:CR=1 FL=1